MRFGRLHGSTRGRGTRRAPARKDPHLSGRRVEHDPQRNPGPCPGSLTPFPVTGPAPEAGPTPTAGPGVDPAAPATPPGETKSTLINDKHEGSDLLLFLNAFDADQECESYKLDGCEAFIRDRVESDL